MLRSLELGEVQTLLLGENLQAQAVECSGCGHLDAHLVSFCPVCGRATQEVVDVGEAILPWVIRRDIEIFYVRKMIPNSTRSATSQRCCATAREKIQPLNAAVADQLGRAGPPIPAACAEFASR